MKQIFTWVKNYDRVVNAFGVFIDTIVDPEKATQNKEEIPKVLECLKKLDILGFLRAVGKAANIESEIVEEIITMGKEIYNKVDQLSIEIIEEVSGKLYPIITGLSSLFFNISAGQIVQILENSIGALNVKVPQLLKVFEKVEKGETHNIMEDLVQVFLNQGQMQRLEGFDEVERWFRYNDWFKILEFAIKVLEVQESRIEEIKELGMQFAEKFENSGCPQKIEQMIGPLLDVDNNTRDNAIKTLIETVKLTAHSDLWRFLGGRSVLKQNWKGVSQCYERVMLHEKEDSEIACDLAHSYFKMGDFEKAKKWVNRSIEIKGDVAKYWSMKSVIELATGNEDASKKDWERAVELDPKDVMIYVIHGYYYIEMNQLDEAEKTWKKIVELSPKKTWFLCEYATTLFLQGDDEESIANFELAMDNIDLEQDDSQIYYYYISGALSLAKGYNKRAIFEFTEFLKLLPGTSIAGEEHRALLLRGNAYENIKNMKLARKDYGEALKLKPKNILIQKTVQKIGTENADEYD
ncbi:lipopolysaccharide assembly protein b [Anaeramoeba flamelloides]|uniref:Lipopolysaccharide assembly protein b n=1 Tax=Anaeramoeba flamelloides TaxID=1746091 RepID=A0ABQ8XC52_9EUKA|nr:lipopolysaccharide assembly protein b [Anaeramoeba flamelloides]